MHDAVATTYAGIAAVHAENEHWDEAISALRDGLAHVSSDEGRVDLQLILCDVLLSLGRLADAEEAVTALRAMDSDSLDAPSQAGIHVYAAELAALRGDLGVVETEYNRAIELARDHGDQAAASSYYAAKHNHLLRGGAGRPDVYDEQDERVDLAYDGLHPFLRARLIEQEGLAAIAEDRMPDALQRYRVALDIYQQYSASVDVQRLILRLAGLYVGAGYRSGQGGYLDKALVLYARAGHTKEVEQLCSHRAVDVGGANNIEPLIRQMASSQTSDAKVGRLAAYGTLADVIPDALLPDVLQDVEEMRTSTSTMDRAASLSEKATKALQPFVPRLTDAQAVALAQDLLGQLEAPDGQSRVDDTADTLLALVRWHHAAIPAALQERLVSRLFVLARTSRMPLSGRAFNAAYSIVLNSCATAVSVATAKAYLREYPDDTSAIAYLVRLDSAAVDRTIIDDTVRRAISAMGVRTVETQEGETSRLEATWGATAPSILGNFRDTLSPDVIPDVLGRLWEGINSPHEFLGARAAMLQQVGNLADQIPQTKVNEWADLCLGILSGGVQVGSNIAFTQQMSANPFSRFRISSGDWSDVAGGALWALCCLLQRLKGTRRKFILEMARQMIADPEKAIRYNTAISLRHLRGLRKSEHDRLAMILMVLLHDADADVRAAAVNSLVVLYKENHVAPPVDLMLRILELGQRDPTRPVRQQVAYALAQLDFGLLPHPLLPLAEAVRTKIQADPSYEVRTALQKPDADEI